MNIFVLNKGGSKIGVLSNQGANPPAPFFDDLFTQELETGADTYYFSSISNSSTENLFVIGNKIMFEYNNKQRLFTIASIEYEHKEGQKIIGVYAEGIGFELLDIFMEKPKIEKEPGNDSDNDGDDDYDDEYGDPDDVWIDADGNIVYIKNRNEGGDDYGSPDDVWIDEDGNICYKKNRNDRDRDSLEIKQLSYPNFLNLILKNTGWSYEYQPGLESNKQDMNIRYNTNIYAILQDSMQSYQGVELEFIYEYNNGSIKRIVKAYKNGGRGSNTGKRLQYGVNVRGITKMQEIVDEYDEDVVYEGITTINGHQVQLTYDVDIALKSMDVEAMRIGDSYTVIDHDFRPVIEFKARIGKIEISFSDPTMNKCYIANFKQIRGSKSDNGLDEDDIKDLIEDYEPEDEIVDDGGDDGGEEGGEEDDGGGGISAHYYNNNLFKAPRMHSYEFLLYTNLDGDPLQTFSHTRTTDYQRLDNPTNNGEHPTSEDMYNFLMNDTYVYDASYSVLDKLENTGGQPSNYCLRLAPNGGPSADRPFCLEHDEQDYMGECTMSLAGSRIFSDIINPDTDRPDFGDPISADHHDKHMLDVGSLACGLVAALQHHVKNHSGSDFKDIYVQNSITIGPEISTVGEEIEGISAQASSEETKISTTGVTTRNIISKDINVETLSASTDISAKKIRVYGDGLHVFSSITFSDGSTLSSANGLSGGAGNCLTKNDISNFPNYNSKDTVPSSYATYQIYEMANDALIRANTANTTAQKADNKSLEAYNKAVEAYNMASETSNNVGDMNNYLTKDDISQEYINVGVIESYKNKVASSWALGQVYFHAEDAYQKAVEALNNSGTGEGCRFNDFFTYESTPGTDADYLVLDNCDGLKTNCDIEIGDGWLKQTGSGGIEAKYLYANSLYVEDGNLSLHKDSEITIWDMPGGAKTYTAYDLATALAMAQSSEATASIDLSEEQQETISALQNTVQQQQETIAALEARLARLEQHLGLGDDI